MGVPKKWSTSPHGNPYRGVVYLGPPMRWNKYLEFIVNVIERMKDATEDNYYRAFGQVLREFYLDDKGSDEIWHNKKILS